MISSQNTAPVRLYNIQALRGLAALLVMISHLFAIDQKYSGGPILPEFFQFGLAGVDLFFVISGFIMVYITQTWQASSGRRIPEFMFARAARIYPIYWLISAVLLMAYLVRPDLVFASTSGEPDILKSFLLWPDENLPLLEVGWTLVHEMGFYLIFALTLFLPARQRIGALIVWAVAVIGGNLAGLGNVSPVTNILFHPLSIEFLLGAGLAWLFLKSEPKFGGLAVALGLVLGVASVTYWSHHGDYIFPYKWHRIALMALPAVLIAYGFAAFERQGRIAPKWSVKLGDWSYSLYLTHILTLSLLGRIWSQFARPGIWDNIFMILLMFAAAIFVAWLTYALAENPMLNLAKAVREQLFSKPT